jgi:hypothetical protein
MGHQKVPQQPHELALAFGTMSFDDVLFNNSSASNARL